MSTLSIGDLVEGTGIGSGARYRGRLVEFPRPGRKSHRILVTWINQPVAGSIRPGGCAGILNVKKVENQMAYSTNLIGPKPEPVQEPKFVAPFRNEGRNIVDANRRVVTRVTVGGHKLTDLRQDLPMNEAYELARLFAEALSEKFGKVEDSKSPF